MKIAFVYDAVYPYVKGGAEKRVYEIGRRLSKMGHEVHCYGIKWWKGEDVMEKDGMKFHGVCKPIPLYTTDGRRSIKGAMWFSLILIPSLWRERFDVIDCQAFPYFSCFSCKLISILKKTPLIITWLEVWGDYWYEYLGKRGVFGKVVERMTTYLTDKHISISERTGLGLEEMGLKKIRVVPVGVDIEKIGRIKGSDEESDVIFVGRLIREKNADILIKAINIIKKDISGIKCIIIGDGPEKEKLERLVYHSGLENNVKFTGFLDHDVAISYMKSSKVLVLPSTREGFGMVALEANACGLPVITVNHKMNASCDFINNDVNGFICELSEEDIAGNVLMGLDKLGDMEKKCIEAAVLYDWKRISNSAESFYQEIVKSHKKS